MQKDCSVIILAAGYSSRMGIPKFTLPINSKTNFLENIINQYFDFGCSNIIVVLNAEGAEYMNHHPLKISTTVQLVINHHPEYEKFYSIQLGAQAIKTETSAFIQPVDLPVIQQKTLEDLYENKEEADYIKPAFQRKSGHPILVSPQIISALKNEQNSHFKLNEFLKMYSSLTVLVDDAHIFDNINTHKEYEDFLKQMDSSAYSLL